MTVPPIASTGQRNVSDQEKYEALEAALKAVKILPLSQVGLISNAAKAEFNRRQQLWERRFDG